MTTLLLSSLFSESDPIELAAVARELGFEGVDLAVRGLPDAETERTLAHLAAEEAPALMLSVESTSPDDLRPWAQLAASAGCTRLRLAPYLEDHQHVAEEARQLAALAAETGVRFLLPNHSGGLFASPEPLADLLADIAPQHVAALLAPDQIPRSRAGDHAGWLGRLRLPSVGAVCLAGYRWDAQIGAGNIRLWSPVPTLVAQSLTPWPGWLQRLREVRFDGVFTFGDPSLPASAAERLRLTRDDLRYLRRVWEPKPVELG